MEGSATFPSSPKPRWQLGLLVGLATLTALLALGMLFRFNPAENGFFPRCAFHSLSGWDCPGCGGQRALHQLLHGEWQAALRCNALLILLLPIGGWYLLRAVLRRWARRALPAPFAHHVWPWVLCGLVISFAIVRNLPGCEWLRP